MMYCTRQRKIFLCEVISSGTNWLRGDPKAIRFDPLLVHLEYLRKMYESTESKTIF